MITVLSPQGAVRGAYHNNVPEATPYFEDKLLDNLETEQTTLEFAVPLQSPDSEWLEGFSTVLYPDKDGDLRELTVINVWEDWSQEQPLKRVVCEDASVDKLLKTHVAPFTAGNLQEAIRGALMASPWEYLIGEDTINIGYYLVDVKEYTDVRSVLQTIKDTYGIEYRFAAKFDGRNITRVLRVAKRFGADTGKYFIYDRDLINIERTVDYDNIHTSVLTYWMEDDVARTLAGYNPVNKITGFRKDIASDLIYHNEAHSEYDSDDYGKVLIMKSSSTDPELSYLEACNKLLDYIAPTYTYTVNVRLLENALGFEGTEQIHLGDTVWLKEKVGDMELGLEARVIELITSSTNPEEDEVTFTNFKEIDVADSAEVNALREMIQQIQNQQDSISQTVVQVTQDITQLQQGQAGIITALDGKSTISIGDTPNPNPKEGDTWFTDVLDPETGKTYSSIKVWSSVTNSWEPRYSAKDAEEARAAAEEAAQAGADAKAAADAAKEAADEATAAGEAASQKADQAATEAAAAKAQADAIQIDVTNIKADVSDVQSDIITAQTDATNALAGVQDALTEIGQVDGKVTTVKNDLDGLTVTVGEVQTTATSAMTKATQVEQTVDGLKLTVASVETTVNNLQVGARNYLKNSESPKFAAYLGSTITYTENVAVSEWKAANAVRHEISGGTGGSISATLRADRLVSAGVKYIHSIYVKNEGTTNLILGNNLTQSIVVAAGESKRVVFNPSSQAAGTAAMQFVLSRSNAADVQKFVVWHAMIAEGTVVNDWVPAVEDMATVAKVTQVEATVNGLTTRVSATETVANNAMTKATQVEQTAEGIKTTILEVQTDLNNISVGGRNLLLDSGQADRTGFQSNNATLYPITKTNMTEGSRNFVRIKRDNPTLNPTVMTLYSSIAWSALSQGIKNVGQVVVSFKARTQVASTWSPMAVTYPPTINNPNAKNLEIGTEWKTFSIVYDSIAEAANGLRFNPNQVVKTADIDLANFYLDVCEYKVEIGNRATDWSPAPEDLATVAKVTQIEATVNGLTTRVSATETVANNALTKATSVEQTANGLTTTVATIQTDITDLTNRFPDFDFKKQTPKPVLEGSTLTATYDTGGVVLQNTATSGSLRAYWSLPNLTIGKTYNIKIYGNVGQSAVNREMEVGFSGGENVKFSFPNTTPAWISGTAKASGNGAALSFWIPNGVALRLRELYIYEANTNITSSQITQLSDNINLKVDKNGVIAQINVSSEGILIDGKYVRITGTTTIDNAVIKTAHIADLAVTTAKIANLAVGTAQIGAAAITEAKIGNLAVTTAKIANLAVTDAKIGSMTADKLTAGTIDAGIISVINLNASNITSGTLEGLTIRSPYDVPIASGATSNRRGSLVMTDGYLRNVYQTYVVSTGAVTGNGELTLTHEALTAVSRTGASTTVADNSMQLHAFGLTLQNSAGQGGTLSFQDLYSQPKRGIIPASGWAQYSNDASSPNFPSAERNGRVVQLAGAFSNNNLLAAGGSATMGNLAVGFRPSTNCNFIVQASGTNIYLLTVMSNGAIQISRHRGWVGGQFTDKDVQAGAWCNIACVYAAADV